MCGAVWCSAVQWVALCVAVWWSVLQCVAVCYSVVHGVTSCTNLKQTLDAVCATRLRHCVTVSVCCSVLRFFMSQTFAKKVRQEIYYKKMSCTGRTVTASRAVSNTESRYPRHQGWSSPPRRFANSAALRHQNGFVRPLWNENEQWNENENSETAKMNTTKTQTQVLNKTLPPIFTHSNAFARQDAPWHGGFSTFYVMVTSRQLPAKTIDPTPWPWQLPVFPIPKYREESDLGLCKTSGLAKRMRLHGDKLRFKNVFGREICRNSALRSGICH